ncbi:MAG: hypothetical protein RIS47_435 [Bacteroidota bacterium]|jgi:PhzF family phenazine biosynthesis protein
MQIKIFQVDAFASKVFKGNPAAVCPLESWLDDELLQAIADENKLSETAFFVTTDAGIELRWFTPLAEVAMCGHATIAAAHVLFEYLGYEADRIAFQTQSGVIAVERRDDLLWLDLPADSATPIAMDSAIVAALGLTPLALFRGRDDIMAIFEDREQIEGISPNFNLLAQLPSRGVIVTATDGISSAFSRWFGPQIGIDEDPVTGSAHALIAPFWADRLGVNKIIASQLSARGASFECEITEDRVLLGTRAITFMVGMIFI